jgi:hypothetical protein
VSSDFVPGATETDVELRQVLPGIQHARADERRGDPLKTRCGGTSTIIVKLKDYRGSDDFRAYSHNDALK